MGDMRSIMSRVAGVEPLRFAPRALRSGGSLRSTPATQTERNNE
jgi:hypothetical protein